METVQPQKVEFEVIRFDLFSGDEFPVTMTTDRSEAEEIADTQTRCRIKTQGDIFCVLAGDKVVYVPQH